MCLLLKLAGTSLVHHGSGLLKLCTRLKMRPRHVGFCPKDAFGERSPLCQWVLILQQAASSWVFYPQSFWEVSRWRIRCGLAWWSCGGTCPSPAMYAQPSRLWDCYNQVILCFLRLFSFFFWSRAPFSLTLLSHSCQSCHLARMYQIKS